MKKLMLGIVAFAIMNACSSNKSKEETKTEKPVESAGDKLFPPIDIKSWDKTPCVNGRLPSKEETSNGTSLLFYDDPDAKAYNIILPKLAYIENIMTKKEELVVVIQMVQTKKDTMVGYRHLAGGNGASVFRDFRFLNDKEVAEAVK